MSSSRRCSSSSPAAARYRRSMKSCEPGTLNPEPFFFLLRPFALASRNRARQWERRDLPRAVLFGGVAVGVCGALFLGSFWLTTQLLDYEELGDFLLRIGLSWL